MSLRKRLMVMVLLMLTAALAVTVSALTYSTKQAILQQANEDAKLLARILARSASMGQTVEYATETMISEDMISSARILADYIAIAESCNFKPESINKRLEKLVNPTDLAEIWITDSLGNAYIHSKPGVLFKFTPDAVKQPQSSAFWPLLDKTDGVFVQPAMPRETDGKLFKYAGISGTDKPRIVQVGIDGDFLSELRESLGIQELLKRIANENMVDKIWVVDKNSHTQHFASHDQTNAMEPLSFRDQNLLNSVMSDKKILSEINGDHIRIAAPIYSREMDTQFNSGPAGDVIGATLIHQPTERLYKLLATQLSIAISVGIITLIISMISISLFTRRITRPIQSVTRAAAALELGTLKISDLDKAAGSEDEVGILAQVFQRMAVAVQDHTEILEQQVHHRTLELQDKNQQLQETHQLLDAELATAHALQQAILPASFPALNGYIGNGIMIPARSLAGDFYDFIELGDGKLGILIADVSDKGVPASFFMGICRTIMRAVAPNAEGPSACLTEANRLICASNPMYLFVTLFYGILDTRTHQLNYANGGHLPPIRLRASAQPVQLSGTRGMALGISEEAVYTEQSVDLPPGDILFLYSDGVSEAFDELGDIFSDARLIQVLSQATHASATAAPEQMIASVIEAVETFRGTAQQNDDITAVCFARTQSNAP